MSGGTLDTRCGMPDRVGGVVLALMLCASIACAGTNYVSPEGSHFYPYTNWVTAATNIHAAVEAAGEGDTVLVTNGTYRLYSEIYIDRSVAVKSVNGQEDTFIVGTSNRCFFLTHADALVHGFSITGGVDDFGGGVRVGMGGGTVQQCTIYSNRTTKFGGGGVYCSWAGIIRDCVIHDNVALNAGDGGGVFLLSGGLLENCEVRGNSARVGGGVIALFHATLRNCLILDNQAQQGGGVCCSQYSLIQNCTISSNTARVGGGVNLFLGGKVRNSIVYSNAAQDGTNCFAQGSGDNLGSYSYTCTYPSVPGEGNITNSPKWADQMGGDYHLQSDSPCIDAGGALGAPGVDIEGTVRPIDGNTDGTAEVDIGAYEFTY